MIVGEQPGDERKIAPVIPFVGPSGRFLEKTPDEVGIHREDIYVTMP